MINPDIGSLAAPHPASSLYFAIRKAPRKQQTALRALYTLHKKWREAAIYDDQHHAVTTLNWWHHELDKTQNKEISHPALLALQPWLDIPSFFNAVQALLHGHMHWHHLTRIETLDQLEPTIDAIATSYIHVWLHIMEQPNLKSYAQITGRTIWWIDQTRHIGHNLTPSRMWLPMAWLKELNLPAHQLLNRKTNMIERAQYGSNLAQRLIQMAQTQASDYQKIHRDLPKASRQAIQSIHALIMQRQLLISEIAKQPQDIWGGLISISPRRKWWATLLA